MNTKIEDLNAAWIEAGNKVSDLNAKISAALLDDSFDKDEFTKLTDQRDIATTKRDALKNQIEHERVEVNKEKAQMKPVEPTKTDKNSRVEDFAKKFRRMLQGDSKILNIINSSTDENGNAIGLTIPEDAQTQIHQLVRQYDNLQQYVNVESVSTQYGSRVLEKWSDVTPLHDLDDESATIPDNDDPKLTKINYTIHRFSGINTATNSLLKDSTENLMAWLTDWIAKKVVVTRNAKIIALMGAAPKKPSLSKFDDIITMINTAVDPAIKATSILLTNTSGFNALSQVKDAMGQYLLQSDPKQPDQYLIKGKRVVEIGDKWLPNGGTANAPVYPLYYGDLSQAATLFDRENMSLLTTNIGAGAFENDQTKIRVIDRFDVESVDPDAFVAGSFTAIADQQANFAAAAAGK